MSGVCIEIRKQLKRSIEWSQWILVTMMMQSILGTGVLVHKKKSNNSNKCGRVTRGHSLTTVPHVPFMSVVHRFVPHAKQTGSFLIFVTAVLFTVALK